MFELVRGVWVRHAQVPIRAQVQVHLRFQVQVQVGQGQRQSLEEGMEVERQLVWMERWR